VLHRLVVRTLRSMFCQPARVADAAMNAAADEFLRAFSTARGRIAFFHAMREIYLEKSHFWDRLPTLSVPTLFLFGDTDWLVPPGFARHVMHAVPRAEVEVLESCGHVPQFEHPELTHARVRHFFATRHS
jgi:pimeloyl-ACP methyl ester carboxylesterase